MSDLISRSKLINALVLNSASAAATPREVKQSNKILQIVREQPPVEAKPVVHGEWIKEAIVEDWGETTTNTCSVCNNTCWLKYNFCPNCGADMRKKVVDD